MYIAIINFNLCTRDLVSIKAYLGLETGLDSDLCVCYLSRRLSLYVHVYSLSYVLCDH